MVQICPSCKRTIQEEDSICPHCGAQLESEVRCPFCNILIDSKNTICPHCGKLLIYEYPKQVTAKRNAVLFPLGFLLLLSAGGYWYLNWREIISANNIFSIGFIILWLIGFALFGAYIGKGDKDFWFGK
jgi:RNA polymerase subunit RPABC4/transcription elongation factor Spt4